MASKPVTITVTTTEVFQVGGKIEAHILADFVHSTGTLYPDSGSWMISDLPQVGDSVYQVEVNVNE